MSEVTLEKLHIIIDIHELTLTDDGLNAVQSPVPIGIRNVDRLFKFGEFRSCGVKWMRGNGLCTQT